MPQLRTALLLKLALMAAAMCQTPRFPLVSLQVTDPGRYTATQIQQAAGLKLEQLVEPADFEMARRRLLDSGHFETVGYRYRPAAGGRGYELTFEVKPVAQAYPVRFARLTKPAEQLAALLRAADPLFAEKIPATEALLKRYGAVLEAAVGEKVIAKVTAEGPDDLKIVFEPARPAPSVAEVQFTGNQVLPATALQNAIAGAAIGSVWDESRFRQLLEANVLPLYEARGRIRAAFARITAEPVRDVNGVRVTVEVVEGEAYTLGEISVETEAAPASQLLKAAKLTTGDLANFEEIKAGLERMCALIRRNGYLQAAATSDRHIDDAKKVVNLTVLIDPGPRFVFGKLHLVGLDILSEPVIRRMWGLKEGQPFNPEYPDYFLQRIREEGVFENLGKTRSEMKLDEKALRADVTLYFR